MPELTPEPSGAGEPLKIGFQQMTATGWKARLDGGPLGPLSVRVDLQHAVVSAQFHAGAEAAPLLQQTSHQLAERLAGQGLALGQFSVNGEAGQGAGADVQGQAARERAEASRVRATASVPGGAAAPAALAYAGVEWVGPGRQWRM